MAIFVVTNCLVASTFLTTSLSALLESLKTKSEWLSVQHFRESPEAGEAASLYSLILEL
jgi:hypothetical protein